LQNKESAFIFNGSELRTQFDQRNIRNAKVAAVGTCGYFSVLKKDRKTGTISVPPEAFNVVSVMNMLEADLDMQNVRTNIVTIIYVEPPNDDQLLSQSLVELTGGAQHGHSRAELQ